MIGHAKYEGFRVAAPLARQSTSTMTRAFYKPVPATEGCATPKTAIFAESRRDQHPSQRFSTQIFQNSRRFRRAAGSSSRVAQDILTVNAVAPAVIFGGGRVGQALKEMGEGQDVILKRHDPWPEDAPEGPIFVATRNDALDAVIEKVPEDRREDLVFMQNGMLGPYLKEKGLENATQVLVYFAVAKLGDDPTDGVTDMNPEGLTAANGKWAKAAAERFKNKGLSCKVLNKEDFDAAMFEKLIWISSFMLVGARHPGATVGDVEKNYTGEVSNLMTELADAVSKFEGVKFGPQLPERLCAYARSVAHFPTAVKEFEWRNGYFNELSKEAYKNGQKEDPCSTHSGYLAELGIGKIIPFPFKGYKEYITEEEMQQQDEILTKFEIKRDEENEKRIKRKKEMDEKRKQERERAESVRKEKQLHEEQGSKARQLQMAKTAAEEETKRSLR